VADTFPIDRVTDGITYDPPAEQVFVGTVHAKPTLSSGRMYFTLWTRTGAVAVEIGPKDFAERIGLKLTSGQLVTVIGMPIVISPREMVLAREITMGDSVFVVRDRNGHPMWDRDRPIEMDPEAGCISPPVC
jgi:hypothetical protein